MLGVLATLAMTAHYLGRLATATTIDGEPATAPRGDARAYVALTKPRIIELLLVTTVPTMVLAQGGIPPLPLIGAVLVGGSLAAGGANAINQYLDRDIDERAPDPEPAAPAPRGEPAGGADLRPRPQRRLVRVADPDRQPAQRAAGGQRDRLLRGRVHRRAEAVTPQNIVIGGAAGCVPVLVAWAAVTNTVGLPALVLFAVIFVWTPPHFWALALRYRSDYEAAGVPMLPS